MCLPRSISRSQRFDQSRISDRKERTLTDEPEVKKSEGATDPDQRQKIENAEMQSSPVQRRKNDDVNIEQLHQQNPAGNCAKRRRFLFYRAQKQDRKRNKESSDDQKRAQDVPRFGVSREEILRFLRNVRVPLEHVLAETDVGPEHNKGEHPFPHDVVMLHRHHVLQITGASQRGNHQHQQ